MNKLKALVLDAGGVLVHPLHGNWNIPVKYRELLGEYANDIPGEKWLQACSAEAQYLREDVFVKDMAEEYDLRLKFLRAVALRMDWKLSEEILTALAEDFTYNETRYAWYDDVLPHMDIWKKKLKLGILSDAMPSVPRLVKKHPIWNYLDALVISTEIGAAKPNALMYTTMCEQLGVEPQDCLFVDDRVCNLEGAAAVGMRVVQMCRDGLEGWNGDVARDLSELNDYLEGLI